MKKELLGDVAVLQDELWKEIVKRNEETAFGKAHHFSQIETLEDYRKNVPINSYEEYKDYIDRSIEGKTEQLTKEPPVYYCITSGSTGTPKYMAITERDMNIYWKYSYHEVHDIIRDYFKDSTEEEIFGHIFQSAEFAKTSFEDGTLNGIRTSSVFQWADRDGTFDASAYCIPKEVLLPEKVEDLLYIRVRFALADENITCIQAIFVHKIVAVLQYIEKNWDDLLDDMEYGTVNEHAGIREEWKEKVKKWLPPNKERARQLRKLSKEELSDHMLKKIWPKIRIGMFVSGEVFSAYDYLIKKYFDDIPIHYAIYGSTEGIFGIAPRVNAKDQYMLLADVGFFEFLEQGNTEHPLLMKDLEVGKKYELIFTNQSGLYRYAMEDVIQVVGFEQQAPVVKVCYRKSQVLNVADEKTNTEQLNQAVKSFEEETGIIFINYCAAEDYSTHPARYLFMVQCNHIITKEHEEIMEKCMCHANFGYAGCRSIHDISKLKMVQLSEKNFLRYEKYIEAKGYPMGQNKPIRIFSTEEIQKITENMEEKE